MPKSQNRIRIDNWIIAFSHVSAFEASAARALVDLGAHVAAVAGEKGGGVEISLRCTREFTEKTGIHLGRDIAKLVGDEPAGPRWRTRNGGRRQR